MKFLNVNLASFLSVPIQKSLTSPGCDLNSLSTIFLIFSVWDDCEYEICLGNLIFFNLFKRNKFFFQSISMGQIY